LTGKTVSIPLRGYVVCNQEANPAHPDSAAVAIPLRGYVVCNADPGKVEVG